MSLRAASLLLLATVLAGCPVPQPGVPGASPDPEPGAQPEPAEDGPSLAGTWTRQGDPALVFNVTDDGRKVHGELLQGGEQVFASYRFDLERKAGKLAGKAAFALADVAGKSFEASWEATLAGDKVTVKQEELEIDDAGAVTKRTPVDHTYAFVSSAPAPAAAPPPPAMDMSAYVTVMGNYKYLLADDLAVGQWVDVQTTAGGQTSVTRTSVVLDAGDAWVLEIDNQMNQKDLIVAVFVKKDSGDAVKGFVGNRGKDGKPKDPMAAPAGGGAAPEGTSEDVTVAAGTFPSKRFEMSGTTTWTGVGGDADGVMLKMDGPAKDELTKLETVTVEVGSTSFQARHLVYSSGMEMWLATSPQAHLKQLLHMKTAQMDMLLKAQGEDAAPAFTYPH